MKKILSVLIFLSLTIVGFGQLIAPKGITVGTGGTAVTLTVTELKFIHGLTSTIQTQLNAKINLADSASMLTPYAHKVSPTLTTPKINENVALTVTSTYLNRVDATSSIQTQLNNIKAGIFNVLDYGAIGDGTHDDTQAIQDAINVAANVGPVILPSGDYKITSALVIPSSTTLRGEGRNFGTKLVPVGCGAFTIDGSPVIGGWVFRIEISDIVVSLTNANATNAVYMNKAYNVLLSNVFFYDQPVGVINGIYVTGSQEIISRDVILYGNGTTRAYNLVGTPLPVKIKIINGDIERYDRGILTSNDVNVDILNPYIESCIVCLDYRSTSGICNIYGGVLGSINGYGIYVGGPNLNVYGADIDPYQDGVRGGAGIIANETTAYPNVNLYNIPRIANEGFFPNSTNLLTVNVYPSPASDTTTNAPIYKQSFDFYKNVIDNTSTNLYKLESFDTYLKCKLTLHGYLGVCYLEKIYDFMITQTTDVSAINITNILDTSGGNWIAVMTVALTPGAGYVMLSVTVDTQGDLGNGRSFPLFGQLDIVSSESGVGGIYLQ
jgi:hypothetical protein